MSTIGSEESAKGYMKLAKGHGRKVHMKGDTYKQGVYSYQIWKFRLFRSDRLSIFVWSFFVSIIDSSKQNRTAGEKYSEKTAAMAKTAGQMAQKAAGKTKLALK